MAHSVTLNWVASTDSTTTGFQGYNVYRGVAAGQETAVPLNGSTPISALTYSDTTVADGGSYFYAVTALLNGLESVHSNEATAVILPFAPTGLVATAH
jgi:hypothetical protein